MKDKVFEAPTVWDSTYIVGSLWGIFNILLILFIAYHVVKLYRVLIKYLESNTKKE